MGTSRRERVQPTHEWELLLPLFEWPEQERYEEIRPLVLFDVPVAERAEEVGLSASTLYRWLDAFEAEGMESLFGSERARRRFSGARRQRPRRLRQALRPAGQTRGLLERLLQRRLQALV